MSFCTFYSSQIKLNFLVQEKLGTGKYLLKVTIKNQTGDFYALPLDISGFKAYYSSEYCGIQNSENVYKYFSPTIMLKDNSNNELIEASGRKLDIIDAHRDEYLKKLQIERAGREKDILHWKNKNRIKKISDAEKNYYLMYNLLLLKPNEELSYIIELDLTEILRSDIETWYDYYVLNFHNYTFSLDLCILKENYLDLTNRQREELKKYKLFEGTVKSEGFSFDAYK